MNDVPDGLFKRDSRRLSAREPGDYERLHTMLAGGKGDHATAWKQRRDFIRDVQWRRRERIIIMKMRRD